jgi:hypothetical protein
MLPSEGIKYLIKGIFVPEVLHTTNVAVGVGLGVKVIDGVKVAVWVEVNVGEMVPIMIGVPL